MKRTFFQKKNGAMVTALMTGPTPESLIAQARGAEFDGTDAIGIELRDLKPEYRTREVFERIIQSVNLPFMFIFYRNDHGFGCGWFLKHFDGGQDPFGMLTAGRKDDGRPLGTLQPPHGGPECTFLIIFCMPDIGFV